MKIIKAISIKEVAKIRDSLIKKFVNESKTIVNPKGEDIDEQDIHEATLEWVIEEIESAFDFDGAEND